MKIDKKAILEAVKEAGRLALFGAISAVLAYVTGMVQTLDPASAQAVIGLLILKFADKYVHKSKNIDANGIAPF